RHRSLCLRTAPEAVQLDRPSTNPSYGLSAPIDVPRAVADVVYLDAHAILLSGVPRSTTGHFRSSGSSGTGVVRPAAVTRPRAPYEQHRGTWPRAASEHDGPQAKALHQ